MRGLSLPTLQRSNTLLSAVAVAVEMLLALGPVEVEVPVAC
jgi:hypothetical protein